MKYINPFNLSVFFPSLRWLVIFLGLVLLQLPFLTADADHHLSGSRGPFTDEGLYTAQFRNATITGHLDLTQMDGIIKEPLFAIGMWLVTHYLVDSMLSCRGAVIISSAFLLAFLATGFGAFSRTVLIAIPLGFLSFYIFHYSHFAMTEILCSLIILAACRLLYFHLSGLSSRWQTLFLSSFLIFIAYACKIQFIYAALIPSLTIFLAMIFKMSCGIRPERNDWINLIISIFLACIFALIYFMIWILPNYEFWTSSIFHQVGERTATNIRKVVYNNLLKLIGDIRNWPIFIVLPFALVMACQEWWSLTNNKESRQTWIALVAPLLAWLMLESHKFILPYLPSRYLVSFYIALAMLGAAGLSMFKKSHITSTWQWFYGVCAIALILSFTVNIILYQRAFQERSYTIVNAQTLFAKDGKWKRKVVMGPWAPTLFWGTGAITLPVWKDYFNDRDILTKYHPSAIVSEVDQADSQGAFTADGIDLRKLTSKVVRVLQWEIHVYEIPLTTR
ncbi:conserved membrane hypothetical protein [Candidatus Methylobacter favarea]|uniref:Uncharacterized protein n=1 Tax=Candidatus Methylobacter favarea TaxID=2707345 RepID=A0A8S0X1S1_9GAMM|nr:hypothetical protein [Candidatus Methylobacter favarea]CAA9891400.1 conserved membrane hypothetical protein [Candidatus Methylobacter favarea]